MSDQPSPYSEPIFFNGLGKSASSFLSCAISQGLNIPQQIAGGAYPLFLLTQRLTQKAATGNYFANHHLPAHPANLYLLNHFYKKMVVHVRDPRQATLSHLRNTWRHQRDGDEWLDDLQFLHDGGIPDGFFERSESAQLDFMIDTKLYESIEWIQGWLDVEKDPVFKPVILFTSYEEFVLDKTACMMRILDFYNIDHDRFNFDIERKPSEDEHLYIKSEVSDEWLSVFTDEQKERANRLMPESQCERFNCPTSD